MVRVSRNRSPLTALTIALVACAAPALLAQEESAGEPAPPVHRVFPSERPSQDARLHRPAVTTDTVAAWEPPADPIEWLDRRSQLTARIRLAGGLWPYPASGLVLVTHTVHDRGDFTVENVLFQGHFFDYVSANIYRPKEGPERMPVVLCPQGHDDGRLMERSDDEARALVESGAERDLAAAKYPVQARCVQLARMGCIVVAFDMVGYGDYTGYDHEQSFARVGHELWARNAYGLQLWNSFQALNHMWNTPGTDRERVGIVGVGGAASQALFLAAIEPRIKATFVAGALSAPHQGGCRCENPSHLRVGTSNAEFMAAIAPRALALTGIGERAGEIEAELLPALERHWRIMGDEDDLVARTSPDAAIELDVHAREAMYAFFDEHLQLGLEGPIVEQPFEPLQPSELRIYDEVHLFPPDGALSAHGVMAELDEAYLAQLDLLFVKEDPHRVRVFRSVIHTALRLMLATELPQAAASDLAEGEEPPPPPVEAELLATEELEGRTVRKLALSRVGAHEEVPAVLVTPDDWNGTVVVGISDLGKAEFFEGGSSSLASAARVVDLGAAFLALDVLLTGEHRNAAGDSAPRLPVDEERHARSVGFTYCYNRTLVAERVHDVLTAIAYARSLEGVKRVNLVGTGGAGPWALMARALAGDRESSGDAVARTAVQWSWDFSGIHGYDDPNFLPGAVRYGGVPYFTALIAPSELRIAGPPDRGAPMVLPEVVQKAYRSLGEMGRVGSVGNRRFEELVDWVAEPAE